MINFPLYVVRKYTSLTTEGAYTIIQTARNKYILDADIPNTTYVERRLALLADEDRPYDLYHLNKRAISIAQILRSGSRQFIDSTGSLVMWKPSEFYKVECRKIESRWVSNTGKLLARAGKDTFVIPNVPCKYVQIVNLNNAAILYDVCEEYQKTTRKKV